MSIINCRYCKTVCIANPNKLCPSCLKKVLDAETVVAEYLRANEYATLDQVHQATKVEKEIILAMIKEGRIIEGKLSYACERCGAAIHAGRLCNYCLGDIDEAAKPLEKEAEDDKKEGPSFYTKDV